MRVFEIFRTASFVGSIVTQILVHFYHPDGASILGGFASVPPLAGTSLGALAVALVLASSAARRRRGFLTPLPAPLLAAVAVVRLSSLLPVPKR